MDEVGGVWSVDAAWARSRLAGSILFDRRQFSAYISAIDFAREFSFDVSNRERSA
ncbi:hypothetical protein [Candidatus Binatus sp.]|uniref:hypothetical protein n=1 Tax=Candidatus Binatus sp. TaxID=2811406 RepID=UPI00272C07AD|nr:hypothetical protein [Candidatus Binatus sp.]